LTPVSSVEENTENPEAETITVAVIDGEPDKIGTVDEFDWLLNSHWYVYIKTTIARRTTSKLNRVEPIDPPRMTEYLLTFVLILYQASDF